MSAPTLDFEVYRQDTNKLEISVVDEAGDAFNLTGVATIRWRASKLSSASPLVFSSTPVISLAVGTGITVVDASAGELEIDLSSVAMTIPKNQYYHELEIVDSTGRVQTVLVGIMTVLPTLIGN